jgi:hypothetical protein
MRLTLVSLIVALAACQQTELGESEQAVSQTCIPGEDYQCPQDPLGCKYGYCTSGGWCAWNQLSGTACASDGIDATVDVCRSGSCEHEVPANSCYSKCGSPNTAGAIGGCSCEPGCENAPYIYDPGNHWGNSGCCADMQTYCAATLTSASSCVGNCGGVAPSGCSCAATCGYTGNCCSDVVTACPAVPAFPDPLAPGAGSDLFETTPIVATSAGVQSFGPENLGVFLRYKKPIVPVARSVAGFARMNFSMVESFDEQAHCAIVDTGGSQMRLVEAGTRHHDDRDELNVQCRGVALRFPSTMAAPTVGSEVQVEQHNGSNSGSTTDDTITAALGTVTPTNMAVLSYMQIGETSQENHVSCRATQSGASWVVQAWSFYNPMSMAGGDGGDVWCGARLVSWDPTLGVAREPEVALVAPHEGFQILGSVYGRTCFLTGMKQTATKDMCELTTTNDDWVLHLRTDGDWSATPTECRATCLTYPTDWPHAPAVRGISTTGPTVVAGDARVQLGPVLAGGAEQPSQGPDVPLGTGAGPGGVLDLFLSPDGVYDKPLLFVLAFNPSNDQGAASYMSKLAPLFRSLQARYGVDIWVLKPSGGRDIRVAAREVANAISRIYSYDPDGAGPLPAWNVSPARKIMVLGFSQGALDARIALATWEDGNRYQNSASGEYIAGLIANPLPPVSLFLSIGGPQREALGSTTVQTVLVGLAGMTAVAVPDSIEQLLSSAPAVEMMRWSVTSGCTQVATQTCSGGVLGELWDWITSTDSPQQVRGLSGAGHYDFATDGDWTLVNESPYQDTGCGVSQQAHNDFYADVNTRGGRHNGFPQSVYSVGLSNGSFSPQGCASFDGAGCSTPAPYALTIQNDACDYKDDPSCNMSNMPDATTFTMNPNTFIAGGATDPFHSSMFATVNYYFTGMTPVGLKACDRDTSVHFLLTQDDLTPGDHRDNLIAPVVDSIPGAAGQVTLLDGEDYFPLVFVPTESALSCPGTLDTGACVLDANGHRPHDACDAICRAANRSDGRFHNVLSNPTDKNGAHAGLNAGLGANTMAYIYEFAVQDGDGLFDPANPWGVPPGEQLDCAVNDPNVGATASASCTTSCGTAGTRTCSNGAWSTCQPNGAGCTSGGGGGCLLAGTEVTMADGSTKNIEDIQVGDRVMSFDFDTGRTVAARVSDTLAHQTEGDRTLVIDGSIRASVNHVFYANGKWIPADQLRAGDSVLQLVASGRAGDIAPHSSRLRGTEVVMGRRTVYDIEVEGLHNYFAEGMLVHNGDISKKVVISY